MIAIPFSIVKHQYRVAAPQARSATEFVGSEKCRACHQPEYELWKGSNHYHAMEVATEASVRGDFNDAIFEHAGLISRFYRKDGNSSPHPGPGGRMGDFEVTHTFGWNPLQQYLIPFPGGRMQCLPIAWDVKAKRWYHLYPDQAIDPKDWLYWTNAAQNWNGMCAACHSTNLKKNYDIQTDTYRTTWSDINVGCEACHGPGSKHVKWAELPDMARPSVENFDLPVRTSKLKSREAVELCAPCHSRRAILGDYTHIEPDLLDTMLPSLLTPDLYFADGQILEEVYAYASFTQSKMYARDVRCGDCHNVHSIKRVKDGNALCLQCHREAEYDSKAHHFHKKAGEKGDPIKSPDSKKVLFEVGTGAECIQCHMPGRYYMGVHYRLDHSIRIPRPDLSVKLSVPDACIRCHVGKSSRWADETVTKWYGPGRRPHYGEILQAGRNRQPDATDRLIRLAEDPLYPVIVRATALELLAGYPGGAVAAALEKALMDGEALIRRTALTHLPAANPERHVRLIAPLLYDLVKAVRTEAAARLAGPPSRQLPEDQRRVFEQTLKEYIAAMEYSGDFAFGRFNLGNLFVALNQPQQAIDNFKAAIKIDDLSYPAKVNLAMFYNQLGRNADAETLLREVVNAYPELHDVNYSLGLLLAEEKKYIEAEQHLALAARGMPDRPRVHYNLGVLYDFLRKDQLAEAALSRAVELEPNNMDYLQALAEHHLKRGNLAAVGRISDQMLARHPEDRRGSELKDLVKRKLQRGD